MERYSQLIGWLLMVTCTTPAIAQLSGPAQFVYDITCNADTDKTVTFTAVSLFGAPARFAYIFDCASTMGENGGSGYPGSIGGGFVTSEDFNIPDCNLEWDVMYKAVMTENLGNIFQDDLDLLTLFMCVRETGTVNVTTQLNVRPGPANSTATNYIRPIILNRFTDQSSDETGAQILVSNIGNLVRFHVWIPDAYVAAGYGIAVHTLTAISDGISITLIGGNDPGCKSHSTISEATKNSDGHVQFDMTAFYIVGSTSPYISFQAIVLVCNETCPDWTCGTRRKRREVENTNEVDAVVVTGYMQMEPYKGYRAPEKNLQITTKTMTTKTMTHDVKSDDVTSCEPCLDTAIYTVIGVLVVAILISVAISLFLFRRFSRFSSVKQMSECDSGKYT